MVSRLIVFLSVGLRSIKAQLSPYVTDVIFTATPHGLLAALVPIKHLANRMACKATFATNAASNAIPAL